MSDNAEIVTSNAVQALVAQRLRRFLFVLSGFIFIGSIVELALTEHFEDTVQLIPFILCGLGTVIVGVVLVQPQYKILIILRVLMAIIFLGSLFGIYEHLEHNIHFALEIQPTASLGDVFFEAFGGANPLLAPGILALGAILAMAATYYHPMLKVNNVESTSH